jgi:hypothetical protein
MNPYDRYNPYAQVPTPNLPKVIPLEPVALGGSLPKPEVVQEPKANRFKISAYMVTVALLALVLLGMLGLIIAMSRQNTADQKNSAASQYKTASISLGEISDQTKSILGQLGQLDINGDLKVNGAIILSVGDAPANPTIGTLYLDKLDKQVYFYNGTNFEQFGGLPEGAAFISLQSEGVQVPQVGNISISGSMIATSFIGSGLQLTNLNASNINSGSLPNSVLTNQGQIAVNAGEGLAGGGSIALGQSTVLSVLFGSTDGAAAEGKKNYNLPFWNG